MSRAVLWVALVLCTSTTSLHAQVFLGKNAQKWAEELKSGDEPTRRNAAFALGQLGGQAGQGMRALKDAVVKDASPKVRDAATYALGEIGRESIAAGNDAELPNVLTKALQDPDPLVRRSAAYALGSLGPNAVAAQDALLDALTDVGNPAVRQNAVWALGKIGSAAVDGMRLGLRDSDALVRRDAAGALAPLDRVKARPAFPDLLPLCKDENSEVRKAALAVLARIVEPKDAKAVGPIAAALNDSDEDVRRHAAFALSNVGGSAAKGAVPVLLESLRKGDLDLRRQATLAIRNVGPDAEAAIDDLMKLLSDSDAQLRQFAAISLGGIGAKAERAVPALANMVGDKNLDAESRLAGADALSHIGDVPPAQKAVPILLEVMTDATADGKLRQHTIWALTFRHANGNLGVLPPSFFQAFEKVLSEPGRFENKLVRYEAAYVTALVKAGETVSASPNTLNVLNEYLNDKAMRILLSTDSNVNAVDREKGIGAANVQERVAGDARVIAVHALSRIGPGIKARPEIMTQLRTLAKAADTLPPLRDACNKLLAEIGN